MKTISKPRKICKDLQEIINSRVEELITKSKLSVKLKKQLREIPAYICDQKQGVCFYDRGYFTIPLWAYKRGQDYFIYYVSHELAHWATRLVCPQHTGHSKYYYNYFKKICPIELMVYELDYKPKNAKDAGISYSNKKCFTLMKDLY